MSNADDSDKTGILRTVQLPQALDTALREMPDRLRTKAKTPEERIEERRARCANALSSLFRSELGYSARAYPLQVAKADNGKFTVSIGMRDGTDAGRSFFHSTRGHIYGLLEGQLSKDKYTGFGDYHEYIELAPAELEKAILSLAKKQGVEDKIAPILQAPERVGGSRER